MMFDDDDGVEPQVKVVDKYYFENSEEEPVCFSILPLHFDNNEEVMNCDSAEKVYLRGGLDKSLYLVHKRVVAWRVELDHEQPKILVLSSEGNWITILGPRKCYKEKIARSLLITVQMLHFIKKHSGESLLLHQLWDHLYEVFGKLDRKPNMDDLRKHHPLVKLILERNPALMKSMIQIQNLQRLIEDTLGEMKEPKTLCTNAQFIFSAESRSSSTDEDDTNVCDCSCNDHDSDDEYSYSESISEDGYGCSENNSINDDSNVDDTDNDDCTDAICAICDDGGKLLSCIGHCKRSFHPRVKDGRESKCRTLGYTSEQLKVINDFLCPNCNYKQHQCFKCGELEVSDELNAKVFKCSNASCGHFYHPTCVAKLLEPDDGGYELAKSIMSGMSFTCPIHWCFKCGKMEDRTQRALQFAICRRCPKSYHRECLPRDISFESKGKCVKRAWELSDNILIYCRDHRIYRATGTAGRNHIKFPCIPEASKTNYTVKKKVKMSGNSKIGIHQHPTESTESLNGLCVEEREQDPRLPAINPEHAAKCLNEPRFEAPVVGSDASPGSLEAVKELEKRCGTSFAKGSRIRKNSSRAMGIQLGNRVTSKADKETSSGIPHDIAMKRVKASALGIYGHNDQDISTLNSHVKKDAEWVRIAGDKDNGERDKTLECYAGEETGDFHENHEQNSVLGYLFLEKHVEVDGSELKTRKEHDSVSGQGKDISTCEKVSGSESEKGEGTSNGSNKCGSGSAKVTPQHIDDHAPQQPPNVAHLGKSTIIVNRIDAQPEYGCGEDRDINGSFDCQIERNNSQSNKNPNKTMDTACDKLRKKREDKEKASGDNKEDLNKNRKYSHIRNGSENTCEGRNTVNAEAHSENQCLSSHKESHVLDGKLKGSRFNSPLFNDENAAADISNSKERTVPNRRNKTIRDIRAKSSHSHVNRNATKRLTNYSVGQEMDHRESNSGTTTRNRNRHRYEHKRHINYSRHDYIDRRQQNLLKKTFSPDFGHGQRWSPQPYLSRQQHGIPSRCGRGAARHVPSRRHSSPVPSRRHSSPIPSRRPRILEDLNYTTLRDNFHNLDDDEYRHRRIHVSPPYTGRPVYGSNRKHTPPFHPISPDIHPCLMTAGFEISPDIHPHRRMVDYGTSRRYGTSDSPRRSEDVFHEDIDYTLGWNSPPRRHYGQYDSYDYGGYSEMDIDSAARYSFGDENGGAYRPGMDVDMEEHVAFYGRPVNDYGEGYLTPKASWEVTDKYSPRFDHTNLHPIGRSSLHYDLPLARW